MRSLTLDQLKLLSRYDFDPALFESWRAAVRDGRLSLASNKITGTLRVPPAGSIADLPRCGTQAADELEALGRAAIEAGELGVVILNGGMATRFGGLVKGTVEVLPGRSFVGLKLEDARHAQEASGGRIPVFLMNSFATDEATRAHLRESQWFGLDPEQVTVFTQFVSVRMGVDGDLLLTESGDISPYGPGHGDCIPALRYHGGLSGFLGGGGKYLFVSNVDNLGARVSPLILGHHIRCGTAATVECAPKWPGDVGGAPYLVDGVLQLVEQLRFPPDFDPDIVDVFNTNTFHFTAAALDRDFDTELGWYFVEKKVEGRKAVQVERLIGEMTRLLEPTFIRVKRTGPHSRFLPIKTPDDLESGRDEIAEMYSE